MPHCTTNHGSTGPGPWLVSMAMWFTCMRFVTEEGVTADELTALARAGTNLNGMERWGYITIDAPQTNGRAKRVRSDSRIRPTAYGRRAQQVWPPLFGLVEGHWRERFGQTEMEELRTALRALADRLNPDLPDCMPIPGYGLFSRVPEKVRASASSSDSPLPVLLARVLLAFAIEFERSSDVSLATSANVLRNVKDEGMLLRELPRVAGVSKEAVAMSVSFLEKRGFVRGTKIVELTERDRQRAMRTHGEHGRLRKAGALAVFADGWSSWCLWLRESTCGLTVGERRSPGLMACRISR